MGAQTQRGGLRKMRNELNIIYFLFNFFSLSF
jgi:hypothetical protein